MKLEIPNCGSSSLGVAAEGGGFSDIDPEGAKTATNNDVWW